MYTDDEIIYNLRGYYDKLVKILKEEVAITLFGKSIIDKKRIDDAICCIDANYPKEFISFREKFGTADHHVRTFKLYSQLIACIKNKPPIGTSSYMVRVNDAIAVIENLKRVISHDLNYIRTNYNIL